MMTGDPNMIGNLVTILAGLWLAYSAIFAVPAGDIPPGALAVGGIVVIVMAAWSRRTDAMGWQSGSNIVLGAALLITAGARWGLGMQPLACFWVVLLAGIAVSIMAMWSMLYHPAPAPVRAAQPAMPEHRAATAD